MDMDEPIENPHKLIADCYLLLLRLPHGSLLRFRAQNAMARSVDYLATRAGVEPEMLQNAFEMQAAHLELNDPTRPPPNRGVDST